MKKKIFLIISIILIAILSVSVLVACKDKNKKETPSEQNEEIPVVPPYEWLDAVVGEQSMMYNMLSQGNISTNLVKNDALKDFDVLNSINGKSQSSIFNYLFKETFDEESGDTLLSLYSIQKGAMILDKADAEIVPESSLGSFCLLVVSEDDEGVQTDTLYDMFGNKVVSIERGANVSYVIFNTDSTSVSGVQYGVLNCAISYNDGTPYEVNTYYFKRTSLLYSSAYEYVASVSDYNAQAVGEMVEDSSKMPLSYSYMGTPMGLIGLLNYKDYTIESFTNLVGDDICTVYDGDGKEVASMVIPADVAENIDTDSTIPLSDTTGFFYTCEYVTEEDEYDFAYYDNDEDKTYYIVDDYYYYDYLAGTLKKVDFNYQIEDVYVDVDIEYNIEGVVNNTQYAWVAHKITVLKVKAIDGKAPAAASQYLVMNADGSIKENISAIIGASKMTEEVYKLGENTYLASASSKSYILDGRLNTIATLNFYVEGISTEYISGYITYNSQDYYGVVDTTGKIVVPFKYTYMDFNNGLDNLSFGYIFAADSDYNEYVITKKNGALVTTKLGEVYNEDKTEIVKYVGYFESFTGFLYENEIEVVTGADEEDIKYTLKSTIKSVEGITFGTVYYCTYDTKEEALDDITDFDPYDGSLTSIGQNITFGQNISVTIVMSAYSDRMVYDTETSDWVVVDTVEYYTITVSGSIAILMGLV